MVMRELDHVHRGTPLEPPFGMALHPGPNRRPIPCDRCGKLVKSTSERDRLVFFICESCRTAGAFAVSSKGFLTFVKDSTTHVSAPAAAKHRPGR